MQYSLDIQTICVDGSVIVDPFPASFEAGGVRWDIVSRDPGEITGTSLNGATLRLSVVPAGITVRIDGEDAGTYLRPEEVPDEGLREFVVGVVRGIRAIRNAAQREGKAAAAAALPARKERAIAALAEPGLYGTADSPTTLPPSRLFETGRARGFAVGDAVVRIDRRSLHVASTRTDASMWIRDEDRQGWNGHGEVTAFVDIWEPKLRDGADRRLTRTCFRGGKVMIRLGAEGHYEVAGDDPRVAAAVASLVGPLAARQAPYLARLDAVRDAERAERAAAEARRLAAAEAERVARAPIEAARRAAVEAEEERRKATRDAEAAALRAKVSLLAVRL